VKDLLLCSREVLLAYKGRLYYPSVGREKEGKRKENSLLTS